MKTGTTSKTIIHLGGTYRFTYHFGSSVIEIEVFEKLPVNIPIVGLFWSVTQWRTIYFGHSTPLREALKFYDEQNVLDK